MKLVVELFFLGGVWVWDRVWQRPSSAWSWRFREGGRDTDADGAGAEGALEWAWLLSCGSKFGDKTLCVRV